MTLYTGGDNTFDEKVKQVLENILFPAFDRFKRVVENEGANKIKKFDFESNDIDYSDQLVRDFYILKYFYAYLYEFYEIYEKLLETSFFRDKPLNVISLGAGSCVDYFGLFLAKEEKNLSNTIKYHGFDSINWNNSDVFEIKDFCFFEQNIYDLCGLVNYLDSTRINIIVFPNSLYELCSKYDQLKPIIFHQDHFTFNVCYIATFRNPIEKIKSRCNAYFDGLNSLFLDSANFRNTIRFRSKSKTTKSEGSHPIIRLNNNFKYPSEIIQYLNFDSMIQKCFSFISNGRHCEIKCNDFEPIPILRTFFIHYLTEVFFNDH